MASSAKPRTELRRPKQRPKLSIDRFVSGAESTRVPANASAERARMTVYLPHGLAKRLRVVAATDGEQISKLVEYAVQAYLERG